MKPPICTICHKRFSGDGGLIFFKETEDDRNYNERLRQPGFVGHPSNAFWFCEKHIVFARKYSELTKTEAFEEIKKENKSDKSIFKKEK